MRFLVFVGLSVCAGDCQGLPESVGTDDEYGTFRYATISPVYLEVDSK